jgi:hypothetical protein
LKIAASAVFNERAGPEINKLHATRGKVQDEIFIFDVPMNDTGVRASNHGINYLLKELPSQHFVKELALCDEIEQIHARRGTFHGDQIPVTTFRPVEHGYDTRNGGATPEETDLQGHTTAVKQSPIINRIAANEFNCYRQPVGYAKASVDSAETTFTNFYAHLV